MSTYTESLRIRVTQKQLKTLQKLAGRNKISVSSLVRLMLEKLTKGKAHGETADIEVTGSSIRRVFRES